MSKQDSIISLLKEINNTVYNSDIETAVDLVVTENDKEYSPNDYNADAFRSVKIEIPKVKVTSINFDDNCLDNDGNWNGKDVDVTNITSLRNFGNAPNAKKIDLTGWNTSNVTDLGGLFTGLGKDITNGATIIGIEDFDTSKVTNIYCIFEGVKTSHPLDLRNWDVSNVTRCVYFMNSTTAPSVNLEGLDFSKIDDTETLYFYRAKIPKINLAYTKHSDVAIISMASTITETIVGDYTIDDVISKNIYIFKGAKQNIYIEKYNGNKLLNRASLRAVINGLEDLTGSDTQTLSLGSTLIAKLTEEDIAIATAKNWTIT